MPFGFLVQTLVIVWYALSGYHPEDITSRPTAEPWYHDKTEPAFEDMLAKLRRTLSQPELPALPQRNPTPTNTATTSWPAPQPPHNCESRDPSVPGVFGFQAMGVGIFGIVSVHSAELRDL